MKKLLNTLLLIPAMCAAQEVTKISNLTPEDLGIAKYSIKVDAEAGNASVVKIEHYSNKKLDNIEEYIINSPKTQLGIIIIDMDELLNDHQNRTVVKITLANSKVASYNFSDYVKTRGQVGLGQASLEFTGNHGKGVKEIVFSIKSESLESIKKRIAKVPELFTKQEGYMFLHKPIPSSES